MVGSAILRILTQRKESGDKFEIITASRESLDLKSQYSVKEFFRKHQADVVIVAAARVGGIFANNTYPAEFIYQNLMIQTNLIHESFSSGVSKLLFLGSSCIYPKHAIQPMKESALLSGALEPTNEPYAIAKIAGIKMCESYNRQYGVDYRCIMPTNLYGPGDNFFSDNSHVIPALINRFHEAKKKKQSEVKVWGSGSPFREFLHVDDMARASLFVLDLEKKIYEKFTKPMLSHINVGSGKEISISQLAKLIKKIVGYEGKVIFDNSMPDGTPRKLMDISRIEAMGWSPTIALEEGLADVYNKVYVSKI